MKLRTKQRLIAAAWLVGSMVLLVEFNKFMKRQVPPCENGVCPVPKEYVAAQVTGPQNVPEEVFMKPVTNPPAVEEP